MCVIKTSRHRCPWLGPANRFIDHVLESMSPRDPSPYCGQVIESMDGKFSIFPRLNQPPGRFNYMDGAPMSVRPIYLSWAPIKDLGFEVSN